MKIFFVIKSLHTAAGTERMTTLIANELSKRGYDTGIICFMKEGEPFFELAPDVRLFYLYPQKDKRASLVRDFSRRKELKKIYRQETPDIVVIVGSGRSMLNIPAARGITTITWEHFNANINWHLMHPFSKKLAAKYCDAVVTLTRQDAENYRRKFNAKNAVCIPNPVTIDNGIKSPLTEKTVLAVGRLMPQKGFDLLLDAWQKVENRHNGWRLRIVGEGKLKPVLQEKIKQAKMENSVEIIPPTNDMAAQYRKASIFVMSSRYEGFGLVLIEAMSMGLPVISFDCDCGPKEIIEDSISGKLIPAFDIEKLTNELDHLMNDEEKRKLFAANAVERAKLFEVDKIMDKWETLFRSL